MNKKNFDTDAILANTNLVELVSRYVELKPDGREYKGLCVAHADSNPSMHVVPDKGFVHCFSCGFHESAIGFLMHMEQISFVDACKKLTGDSGEDQSLPNPKPIPKRTLKKAPTRRTFAPPAGTPNPDMELKGLGSPIAEWTYRTLTGELLGYVARYADTDRKQIRVWSWGNRADHEPAGWSCGHFSEPRPLYGQEKLVDTEKQVIIVEGEKAADAAAKLFPNHIVLTWPGGANSVHVVDWALLKSRKVVLIPDNDEAGRQAMERIAAYLYANGAEQVKGIDVDTQPDGTPTPKSWDLADAAGWTPESTLEWAKSRILVYPDKRVVAPEPTPATQDTPAPAATQPTPAKSKPDLGVVDGNTVRKPRIATGIEAEPELPPEFSEFGMAESWVEANMQDWRYTTRSREWRFWNGNHWQLDETEKVNSNIKSHITQLNSDSRDLTPTQRNRVCTWKTSINVRHLCAADQRIAVTPMQWDADPLLLGTPTGTVDLKTGELRPTKPEDMITKSTAVTPEPGPHPWWDMVLERAHKGNKETADFIQRWCGYMLTGDTREEKFLLIHGAGGGGKSKFLTPLKELMGEYHKLASFETFTTVGNNRGSVDEWARLSGARLVTASEPEEGARWREGAIKQATGRDGMTARHMYQSTFDYMPQFKLVFMGNHKPQLRSIGEEMRRRIDLLEWSGSIPQEQRIADLPDRLRAEYPAILAWMIQGAIMWQERGLARPEVVASNTSEYMESEDVLGQWLDDCIELADGAFTLSSALYESFAKWCEANGEYCAPMRRFSLKMEERGYVKYRKTSGRGFMNVIVKMA